MHIPDGYLGPQTYLPLDAALVPIWAFAAARLKRSLRARQIPLLSLGAAFSFIIMMFNVPVVGGATGHAVGATLIAILLGPLAATLCVSIALVIQALLFGDGGITALGANCLNMAVVMPLVGYHTYRLISGGSPGRRRRLVAAGVGGYVSLVAGAILAGIEFGIQPLLAHTADGQPLYAPFPLAVAVPAMALEHLLFFGFVEAAVTVGVVAALDRQGSALLELRPASWPMVWLWAGLGLLILLTPLGALAPGTAWGEWGAEELREMLGFVPRGLESLGGLWSAAIPDYAPAFIKDPLCGYLLSAVVGAALTVGITWGLGAVLASRAPVPPAQAPPAPPVDPAP